MDIAVAAIHAGVDVPVAHRANPRWRVVEHHVHRLKEVQLVRRAVFGFADSRLDFTASATMPDNTPYPAALSWHRHPWLPCCRFTTAERLRVQIVASAGDVKDRADLPWLEARDQSAGLLRRDSDQVNVLARSLLHHLIHDRQ